MHALVALGLFFPYQAKRLVWLPNHVFCVECYVKPQLGVNNVSLLFGVEAVIDGLKQKGHTVSEATLGAVVQAIVNRCRRSSSSWQYISKKRFRRHMRRDDDIDEACIIAVSDRRKYGAPSGF